MNHTYSFQETCNATKIGRSVTIVEEPNQRLGVHGSGFAAGSSILKPPMIGFIIDK